VYRPLVQLVAIADQIRLDQVACPIEALTGATLVARTGPNELVVITGEPASGSAAATAVQLAEALGPPFRDRRPRARAAAADRGSGVSGSDRRAARARGRR
jgi:NADPH:quinone reductase-like Zn-dependent oxidoreductase